MPVVVANYSDEDRGVELAAFHLPEATHALSHPQVRLFFEGQEVLGAPYGRMFIFPVHLAPRTERTYYLYVREGAPYAAPEGRLEGALAGSFMLAEQVVRLPVRLRPDEKAALAQILSSEVNRLKNPSFEVSAPMPEGWTASSDAGLAGVKIGVEETGGALGPRCATVNVAADAKIDDGKLDLLVAKDSGITEFMALAKDVVSGNIKPDEKNLLHIQAKSFAVEADEPVESDLDGERGPMLPLHVDTIQRAIRIYTMTEGEA